MKKLLWFLPIFCLLFGGQVRGQVIADFEDSDNGFGIGWGDFIVSVSQTADPTGMSDGVLALALNAGTTTENKGALQITNLEVGNAHAVIFYVYLPADTPDSILVKTWAQDQSWTWADHVLYTVNIPKEVWFPLAFNFKRAHIMNNDFDVSEGALQKAGLEFGTWNLSGDDTTWTGTIYVDNVSLIGAEPNVIADFETSDNGFGLAWGDFIKTVSQATDPTGKSGGVLEMEFDAATTTENKGAVQKTNIDVGSAKYIGYYIYLPADTPDSILVKTWAQDQSWTWHDFKFYTVDFPKEVWYPIYFPLEIAHIQNGDFDVAEGPLQKIGLEFGTWDLTGDDTTWSGTIYLDDAVLLGTETGAKWILADFDNPAGGTQQFLNTGWGPALTNISQIADPMAAGNGVLNTEWNFVNGGKGAFERGGVNLYSTELDTFASQITFDLYLPADMPQGAQVSIFARNPWTEDKFFITDTTLIPGQLNTISYDVVAHVTNDNIDPKSPLSVGCQIYYGDTTVNWTGSVYWDNFTLVGIPEPEGELASPAVVGAVDTSATFVPYAYNHLQWIDNPMGTETYNVYMSHNPITDVTAEGVVRIATKVPHGHQQWGHRPWSRESEEQTFYYVITAVGPDGTETGITGDNMIGPLTLTTSVTAKATYDADFNTKFTLDGLDTEFADYKANTVKPESAGGTEGPDWNMESTDMNFNATFVIDDKFLYISADVTDNDLRQGPYQAWEGDALEFYMGFYNANLLSAYHGYQSVGQPGTGDWRIGFTAYGSVQLNGTTDTDIPGVESTVFQKFTGDGYIIEAKIALDSVAGPEGLNIIDGAVLPLRIDGNDMDPALSGDTGRSLIIQFGNAQDTHEDWKRPSCWGYLEVFGGPVGVEQVDKGIPREFRLYSNYPNPFNPTTTIQYDLAEKSNISIEVFDVLGKKVKTLLNLDQAAGEYSIRWDGKNDAGVSVTSGVYFYKMVTPKYTRTQKMMLLK